MKNSFLFFIFFTLTAQISFAKSHNLSSCFKSEKCLNLEAEDSVALDNAFVRVLRYLAACAVANTPNFVTRIIVELDKLKLSFKDKP